MMGKSPFRDLSLVEDEEREILDAGDASAALQELEYDTRHLRERLSIVASRLGLRRVEQTFHDPDAFA